MVDEQLSYSAKAALTASACFSAKGNRQVCFTNACFGYQYPWPTKSACEIESMSADGGCHTGQLEIQLE